MSVVSCNRAEVVECSCLKPCWSGAGRWYMLMVWRIRVSCTYAGGQRSEIGRYEDPWEVSLPGLGIGMINEDFHIAGIWQLVTKRIKRAVIYSIALYVRDYSNGKCWICRGQIYALLFLQLLISLVTLSAVSVCAISIGFILVSLPS